MNIIFDIETAPDEVRLEAFKPAFEASKVLKDPEKIKADLLKKEEEWKENVALSALTGKIIALGIMEGESIEIVEGKESEILEKFWSKYMRHAFEGRFIGHCIRSFDVPFIVRRSLVNGVKIPNVPVVMVGRYLNPIFVDTMEAWACGTRDMISLDNLSKVLGVGAKNGEAADFYKLYSNQETKQQALEYLKNDLTITRACAQKMGLI